MRKTITGSALAIALLALSSPAYAYLDPGTGSMLLQGLIAGVAASATIVSINYHRLKTKLLSLFGKGKDNKFLK